MTDTREDILARLRDIAEDVDGVEYAARNVIDITETKLPAVAVLEGDEEPSPSTNPAKHRDSRGPIPMVMSPEVCIVASESVADIGPSLNALRAALIKAVLTDADLLELLGANGAIAYRGLISDLGLGRAMMGRMALRFAITYFVKPLDL